MRVSCVAAACAAATFGVLPARAAVAQSCTRPTDASGAHGYAYGAAAVKSFGASRVLVWYVTTGAHAVRAATTRGDGVPDDVADVARVTDDAIASYTAMGFRAPIADDVEPGCGSNGGDGRLDVYLVHMAGADGVTYFEPDRCDVIGDAVRCASYILAQANFTGAYPTPGIGIRTVLPHETFHAVQNAYDANVDRFWAEGTAQWAAATLDPSLTDLERFLPAFFSQTSRSLDAPANGVTSAFLYGAAIWPLFLTQRHGGAIVRAIFEAEANGGLTSLAATDLALTAFQSSVAQEYPLFSAWNAAAGVMAIGGYVDGAQYPKVTVASLPRGASVQGITSGLGSFFYRGRFAGGAVVSFATDAARNAGTMVPIADGVVRVDRVATVTPGVDVTVAGDAIIVVSGITTNKTDAPFTITVAEADGGVPDSDASAAPDGASAVDADVGDGAAVDPTTGAGCGCDAGGSPTTVPVALFLTGLLGRFGGAPTSKRSRGSRSGSGSRDPRPRRSP